MDTDDNPWNESADAYARWIEEREPVHAEAHLILSRLLALHADLRGKDVLDAGCGEGYLARVLAQRGAQVIGIDLSPRLIEIARKKDPMAPSSISWVT